MPRACEAFLASYPLQYECTVFCAMCQEHAKHFSHTTTYCCCCSHSAPSQEQAPHYRKTTTTTVTIQHGVSRRQPVITPSPFSLRLPSLRPNRNFSTSCVLSTFSANKRHRSSPPAYRATPRHEHKKSAAEPPTCSRDACCNPDPLCWRQTWH